MANSRCSAGRAAALNWSRNSDRDLFNQVCDLMGQNLRGAGLGLLLFLQHHGKFPLLGGPRRGVELVEEFRSEPVQSGMRPDGAESPWRRARSFAFPSASWQIPAARRAAPRR